MEGAPDRRRHRHPVSVFQWAPSCAKPSRTPLRYRRAGPPMRPDVLPAAAMLVPQLERQGREPPSSPSSRPVPPSAALDSAAPLRRRPRPRGDLRRRDRSVRGSREPFRSCGQPALLRRAPGRKRSRPRRATCQRRSRGRRPHDGCCPSTSPRADAPAPRGPSTGGRTRAARPPGCRTSACSPECPRPRCGEVYFISVCPWSAVPSAPLPRFAAAAAPRGPPPPPQRA